MSNIDPAPPMRVCHLGKFYPPAPGGIESHVRTLAIAQARLGMDVTVLCINHLDRHGRDATWARYGATRTQRSVDECGVKVIRVGRSMTVARVDFCPMLPRIVRQINSDPPDLFHLHTPNVTMLLTVAALTSAKVPLVITHHSDIVRQRMRRMALAPYERRVYKRAAAILVSAKAYGDSSEMLQRYGEKIQVLPMGLDLTPFQQHDAAVDREVQRLRSLLGAPLWLCVGRLVYYKAFHVAIEALAQVPGRLLIIGRGPLGNALRNLAAERGVAGRIIWWDIASDSELRAAYRLADALWFPSNARSEAYGLVQVEAMASGCPVINTAVPNSAVAWVSRHEESGLTVPMNNPRALAAAAQRILGEPGLRARLAEGGRRRAAEEFSQDLMADRSAAIYQRVLQRAAPTRAPVTQRLTGWVKSMDHLHTSG